MIIFLIGYMGSGKSHVGRALARLGGWQFMDMDREFEKREKRSVAEYFEQFGEISFREKERELLEEIISKYGNIETRSAEEGWGGERGEGEGARAEKGVVGAAAGEETGVVGAAGEGAGECKGEGTGEEVAVGGGDGGKNGETIVVATGGGVPCYEDSMSLMKEAGVTLYLKLTPEHIFSRLNKGREKRPLLRGMGDGELMEFIWNSLEQRERYYSQAAITIDSYGVREEYVYNHILELCEFKKKTKEN